MHLALASKAMDSDLKLVRVHTFGCSQRSYLTASYYERIAWPLILNAKAEIASIASQLGHSIALLAS